VPARPCSQRASDCNGLLAHPCPWLPVATQREAPFLNLPTESKGNGNSNDHRVYWITSSAVAASAF
jgi:hypothetical protein